MKTLLALVMVLCCMSCTQHEDKIEEKEPPHIMRKPFVIVSKFSYDEQIMMCKYMYQDSTGFLKTFVEYEYEYQIGDTIK